MLMLKAQANPRPDLDNRASQGRTGNQNLGGSSGSDPYNQSRTGGASNAGPHDSSMGNKMDPRVDSDMGRLSHKCTNIPMSKDQS